MTLHGDSDSAGLINVRGILRGVFILDCRGERYNDQVSSVQRVFPSCGERHRDRGRAGAERTDPAVSRGMKVASGNWKR